MSLKTPKNEAERGPYRQNFARRADCFRIAFSAAARLLFTKQAHLPSALMKPARLHAAGIRFCIPGGGRFRASMLRNLHYHAAMAVALELPEEVALAAIMLSPAESLGVADRVGPLAAGKNSTLIITNGDPLESTTQVEAAFMQCLIVNLDDRHKRF